MSEIDKKEVPPSIADGDNPITSNSDDLLSENKTDNSATISTDETCNSGIGDCLPLTTATTVEDLLETPTISTENAPNPLEPAPSGTSDATPGKDPEDVSPNSGNTSDKDEIVPEDVNEAIEQPTESQQDDLNPDKLQKDHDSSGHDSDFILKWDDDDDDGLNDDGKADGKPDGDGNEIEKDLAEFGLEVEEMSNAADKTEETKIVAEVNKMDISVEEVAKVSTEDEVNNETNDISIENQVLAIKNLSETESVSTMENVGIKEKLDKDEGVGQEETMDDLENPIEESKIDNVEANKELTVINTEILIDNPNLDLVADANKQETLDVSDQMQVDTIENTENLEKIDDSTENHQILEKIDEVTEKMDVAEEILTNVESIEEKNVSKHELQDHTEVTKVTSPIASPTANTDSITPEEISKTELLTENVTNAEKTQDIDTEMVDNTNLQVNNSIKTDLIEEISITDIKHKDIAANSTLNDNEMKTQDVNIAEEKEDDSFDVTLKNHGVNKPDVMIEVPTQELIDLMDDSVNISADMSLDNETGIEQHASQLPDTSDAAEMADSLGLLAESSRVRVDDDDDQIELETSEQDDDDDQFDGDDESSNQTALDQSDASIQNSIDLTSNVIEEIKTDIAIPDEKEEDGVTVDKDFELKSEDQSDMDNGFGNEAEEIKIEVMDTFEVEVSEDNIVTEEKADFDKVLQAEDTIVKATEQETADKPSVPKQSSPKKIKLEISKPKNILNIIDLEESSDDETQIVDVKAENVIENNLTMPEESHEVEKASHEVENASEDKLSVNICKEIEVMSVGENTSDMKCEEGGTVIKVPKQTVAKVARLNTSEVSIKTSSGPDVSVVIPEKKISESKEDDVTPKFGLEVFNLDSDDEHPEPAISPPPEKEKQRNKCVNSACTNEGSLMPYHTADPSTVSYYDGNAKKRNMVCQTCAEVFNARRQKLIEGVKDLTPFLQLEMKQLNHELVEISDSESDGEGDDEGGDCERILQAGVLEKELANMFNETWVKYKMDDRLKDTEKELELEIARLELESAEVSEMLSECQLATDKLRRDLYATFEVPRAEKPAIIIFDTPERKFSCVEPKPYPGQAEAKRRLSSASESQAKKPANKGILYGKLSGATSSVKKEEDLIKMEDDKDVSVVRLSVESAPPDLPPPGDVVRAPLQIGMPVYAMKNAFGSWLKARIVEFVPKLENSPFTMCRVRFENRNRNTFKVLPARCLAYEAPSNVRMTIGTRLIALFKDTTNNVKRESYYSGVVAEIANPVNKYRYLVFFDDGYAQYVRHADTRLVCESSSLVWEEVHPFSREFVKKYLLTYPERPMVRLFTGQSIKTEWNGKWWVSQVINVDASLVEVYFEHDKRTEWIYRGSTRLAPLYLELQAAEKPRNRLLPRNRLQTKQNMPYVEYTRSYEQDAAKVAEANIKAQQEEIRRQRAVAKKSTAVPTPITPNSGSLDAVTSRVVYYTPKNAVRPYKIHAFHACSPSCKRTDVLHLNELRTYNPLAKPLLSGWERQTVRFKGHKEVMYRAPCGRRIRNMSELHYYLRLVHSDMGVDLFDFGVNTHCLAEFVLNKCIVGKKDLSHGKENVPIPCVNYYDDSLPEFCSYNTERTPTAGVPLNLDPDFLCGCDCTDDCEDKSKCACWKLTLEGARTIGLEGDNVGYVYKRLAEPLPSGIYECNSRCKCKSTCLNRVAQHPLQLKLQVFKTLNRGWGIRALNDVPKGSFLCIYAGNLLTDATANLDGLNEGDEYLAELDYIEVVEQMKEGYEDDIPELDQKLVKKESGQSESEPDEESEEEETPSKNEDDDGDFQPGFIGREVTRFSKRLRKREKKEDIKKEMEEQPIKKEKDKDNPDEDCITISDDEELRQPSRFAAQAGMGNNYVPKYKSVRSHFGKDEACYIMDAKVQGNIGRYLNHSCSPNVFVQNVFVDTHDPRFPWVAFFALSHIRAGTELTWNYNYDVGSVPGKALYCYCGAANCRGRLL